MNHSILKENLSGGEVALPGPALQRDPGKRRGHPFTNMIWVSAKLNRGPLESLNLRCHIWTCSWDHRWLFTVCKGRTGRELPAQSLASPRPTDVRMWQDRLWWGGWEPKLLPYPCISSLMVLYKKCVLIGRKILHRYGNKDHPQFFTSGRIHC